MYDQNYLLLSVLWIASDIITWPICVGSWILDVPTWSDWYIWWQYKLWRLVPIWQDMILPGKIRWANMTMYGTKWHNMTRNGIRYDIRLWRWQRRRSAPLGPCVSANDSVPRGSLPTLAVWIFPNPTTFSSQQHQIWNMIFVTLHLLRNKIYFRLFKTHTVEMVGQWSYPVMMNILKGAKLNPNIWSDSELIISLKSKGIKDSHVRWIYWLFPSVGKFC